MAIILSVLIFLTCIILILAVLIQNPKGGGLASGFSTGAQVMGVRRTADFLEKATWTLAVLLFVFSIATTSPSGKGTTTGPDGTSTTKDKAGEFDKKTPSTPASPFGAPQTTPVPPVKP